MKKMLVGLLVFICMTMGVIPALAEESASVNLRIEGMSECLYCDAVSFPAGVDLTVLDVIKKANDTVDTVDITIIDGAYGSYVSAVNGIEEGAILYDGWMFTVNGAPATVGISQCAVKNGDTVVLYYSDAYGTEGFQYPVMDATDIKEGVLRFTSTDVTYDASYNPVETVNPVLGATVTWQYNQTVATYMTDADGKITINKAQLTAGAHAVQIEKYSKTQTVYGNPLPLVLRLAPGTVVTIAAQQTGNLQQSLDPPIQESKPVQPPANSNPKTGDALPLGGVVLAAALLVSIIICGQLKKYEQKI